MCRTSLTKGMQQKVKGELRELFEYQNVLMPLLTKPLMFISNIFSKVSCSDEEAGRIGRRTVLAFYAFPSANSALIKTKNLIESVFMIVNL